MSITHAHAQSLLTAKPEAVGLSSERLGPGFGFGLGFAVRTASGEAPSAGGFNWGGAAGTTFWIDPKEDLFVVFMTQDPKQGRILRPLLKGMIYAAVDKPAAAR